jgi:hypothetical protein
MTICLSRSRIPFAGEYALSSIGVIEGDVKTSDSGEKIDELVGGLLCHAEGKHKLSRFKSHKWTPVHPGERR